MLAAAAFVRQPGVVDGGPVAVVRDGADVIVCTDAVEHVAADGDAGLRAFDHMWRGGFWVGALAYDLGRAIERVETAAGTSSVASRDDRGCADVVFTRFAKQFRFTPTTTDASFDLQYASQTTHSHRELALGGMASSLSRQEHAAAVAAVQHHLRAGDCYQVNVTRRLSTPRRADPLALFAALAARNPAPHAALVELDGVTLV